jgi:hypothetical protein
MKLVRHEINAWADHLTKRNMRWASRWGNIIAMGCELPEIPARSGARSGYGPNLTMRSFFFTEPRVTYIYRTSGYLYSHMKPLRVADEGNPGEPAHFRKPDR